MKEVESELLRVTGADMDMLREMEVRYAMFARDLGNDEGSYDGQWSRVADIRQKLAEVSNDVAHLNGNLIRKRDAGK